MNKSHIAKSFGQASQTYEDQAPVQNHTASWLCEYVKALELQGIEDCLEIGCGTGFLSRKMVKLFPNANWVITDLSPDMVNTCKERLDHEAVFQVMDGEHPAIDQKFDLIVSSLAIQWFQNLEDGLSRLTSLLKPGGRLVFTTLCKDTFKEWNGILTGLGLESGLHAYPSLEDLSKFDLKPCKVEFKAHLLKQPYQNALDFLHALKAIGAHAPKAGYRPLSVSDMRRVMKAFTQNGVCEMTYDVLLGDILAGEVK